MRLAQISAVLACKVLVATQMNVCLSVLFQGIFTYTRFIDVPVGVFTQFLYNKQNILYLHVELCLLVFFVLSSPACKQP